MTIKHDVRIDRSAHGSMSSSSVDYNNGWNCYNHGKSLPSGCGKTFTSGYRAAQRSGDVFITSMDEARANQSRLIRRLAKDALKRDDMPPTRFNINRYIVAARKEVKRAGLS